MISLFVSAAGGSLGHTPPTRDAARIVDLVRHELVWIRYPIDLWNNKILARGSYGELATT